MFLYGSYLRWDGVGAFAQCLCQMDATARARHVDTFCSHRPNSKEEKKLLMTGVHAQVNPGSWDSTAWWTSGIAAEVCTVSL
jgi:hypothetical protein